MSKSVLPKVVMGCAVARNIRRRSAKKHVPLDFRGTMRTMAAYGPGSIVSTCSGLNCVIESVEPFYEKIGNGFVLTDITVHTNDGQCSLRHCGIGPPLSYEEAVLARSRIVSDNADNLTGLRFSPEIMTINTDGTYSIDEVKYHDALESANEGQFRQRWG